MTHGHGGDDDEDNIVHGTPFMYITYNLLEDGDDGEDGIELLVGYFLVTYPQNPQ